MAGSHRRPDPERDDRDLIEALNRHGRDHEPDLSVIRRHVAGGAHADVRPVSLYGRSSRLSVVLSTAALIVVVAGVVGIVRGPAGGWPGQRNEQVAISAIADPVPAPTSSAAGSTESAAGAHPVTGSHPVTGPHSVAGSHPVAGAAGPAGDSTEDVVLGRTPMLDWLAVGSRADLQQVRATAAGGSPVITLDQPLGATSVAGPYRVSWSGGTPEQQHENATRWLATEAGQGLNVRLASSRQARTIVLYTGAGDAETTLRVEARGITATRTEVGSAVGSARSFVLTVRLPPTTGPVTMSLTGSKIGPVPRVYLAAVTATVS